MGFPAGLLQVTSVTRVASSPGLTASDVTPRALPLPWAAPFFYASPLELPSAALGCGFSHGTRFPQPGDVTCCGLTNTKLLKERCESSHCVQEKSKKYSR